MSLFGGTKPSMYRSQLVGLGKDHREVYFRITKRGEEVINQDPEDPRYGTNKINNIKGFFKGFEFDTVETDGGPQERIKLYLEDVDGVQVLCHTSFRGSAFRRFIGCFERGQRIGYLELVSFCFESSYVDKDTGKDKACWNKGFAVWHNGVKLNRLEDHERDQIAANLEKVKIPRQTKEITVRGPLDDYMKDLAMSFKEQERISDPLPVASKQEVAKTDSIIDAIKSRDEDESDLDLPF